MRLKRWIASLLSVLTVISCVSFSAACTEENSSSSTSDSTSVPGEMQTITIPTVTVDLVAPENKVEVSANEKSEVYDASGKKLSSSQWLLNSKFSKAYIRSLGVGEYTFTYKSATKTGTITLIVTDDAEPAYLFLGEIPELLSYMETTALPLLKKNQDSYQTDYEPTYSFAKAKDEEKTEWEAIEYAAIETGFQTYGLAEGEYLWSATVGEGAEAKTFSQSFTVQSFESYDASKRQEMLYDEQTKSYIPYGEGKFHIDLSENKNPAATLSYTVDWEVTNKAMQAGKTRAEFKVTTDKWFKVPAENYAPPEGHAGAMWVTNSWQGYVIGIDGNVEHFANKETQALPSILKVEVNENGTYTYTIVIFLLRAQFEVSKPLSLSFTNGCSVKADVELSFS